MVAAARSQQRRYGELIVHKRRREELARDEMETSFLLLRQMSLKLRGSGSDDKRPIDDGDLVLATSGQIPTIDSQALE